MRSDPWTILLKFDFNCREINSKRFQIFYFGNKNLTGNICLVSGCDISMLVRDDRPDKWNAKSGNFKILMYMCCGMYLINCNFIASMERVFVWSE